MTVTATERFVHQGLLGTVIEVRVDASPEIAAGVDAAVVTEIRRLEQIFSIFDPTSSLRRWSEGRLDVPPAELSEVADQALSWMGRTDGRVNPAAGLLTDRWKEAESTGCVPSSEEMTALAAALAEPRYRVAHGRPIRTGDCRGLDFNALAKGYIVDRAVDTAMALAPDAVVVGAGGDLRHGGRGWVDVGVENPLRPWDNEPPLETVSIANAAVATSGGARRGVRIDGRWFSHVIDPRSGRPADAVAGATVVAADTLTADVLATAAAVSSPAEAVALLDRIDGAEGTVVATDGTITRSAHWQAVINRGGDTCSQ